jgi:zinc transport system ATP-binding protein
MKSDSAVELSNVSFSYGATRILEDVNISLPSGEFISIVGPNGGGKTTLIKLILGLLRPETGKINVFGRSPVVSRNRIGYMPQDTSHDPRFPISVLDVVLMGCIGRGRTRKKRVEIAEAALEEVGMSAMRSRTMSALSGGQKRRVLIARALACEPQMLVLDEPMASLDLIVENELYSILRELSKRLTVLMVSHDLAFVSRFVNSVVCVNRTVAIHPTAEVDGDLFSSMFGQDIRMVLHDQHFMEEGD